MFFIRFLFLYVLFLCLFFFFKQKTAYEMRISDWSSDVCSSDLLNTVNAVAAPIATFATVLRLAARKASPSARAVVKPSAWSSSPIITFRAVENLAPADDNVSGRRSSSLSMRSASRSEEHTSELQSLMRISYAVFCLKKKI